MSEAYIGYRSSIGHCSVYLGHWKHMMLILHDYCRTICPAFCPKTSDIGVKTSDMSGCPTVFFKNTAHWTLEIAQHTCNYETHYTFIVHVYVKFGVQF